MNMIQNMRQLHIQYLKLDHTQISLRFSMRNHFKVASCPSVSAEISEIYVQK